MDEFKNSNNVESLTLLYVLREKLDGGIGAVVVRDVVLCLCAKDIVHLLFTSFFKQLNRTIDILAIVKDHLRGMRSIYTLYPEPDFVRPEIYFAETNILLNACRDAHVKDVKCIFTYNDQYLPYIRELLSDVYRDCPKTVKNMLCYAFPVKHTMGKIDFNFYELKNVLHECICSYSEQRDADDCQVRSEIIQYIFTHAPRKLRSFYSLPMDLILNHAPGRPNGSIVYAIDGPTGGCTAATLQQLARKLTIRRGLQLETGESGGNTHLHIPWYPMQCVVIIELSPHQHNLAVKWFIKYNPCSIPVLHLIYFSCYHWGMDYFYQCQPQFVERRVIDSIPKHEYMLKKMEATEKVGRKLFDAAKAAGILNNVFQLATRNMVVGQHVVYTDVTLLDLYQIVFAEVKQVVALEVGRCTTDRRIWERCMQSYDEAVAAKFKQLRGEYGMRFRREY